MSRLSRLETLLERVRERKLQARDASVEPSGLFSEPVPEVGDTYVNELRDELSEPPRQVTDREAVPQREVPAPLEEAELERMPLSRPEVAGDEMPKVGEGAKQGTPAEGVLKVEAVPSVETSEVEEAVPLQLVGRQAPALFVDVLDLALSLRVREET